MSGVWPSGSWHLSKVFKDKDTDQWGKEGVDIPWTAHSTSKCSYADEWQAQVFGEKGVWCGGCGSWRVTGCWGQREVWRERQAGTRHLRLLCNGSHSARGLWVSATRPVAQETSACSS